MSDGQVGGVVASVCMANDKWLAVDLDGTLAVYDVWSGEDHIGDLVLPVAEKIKQRVNDGWKVAIFTARVSGQAAEAAYAEGIIWRWLEDNNIANFISGITANKHKHFREFWDDRAIAVVKNHGIFTEEWLRSKLEIEQAEVKRLQGLLYAKNIQSATAIDKLQQDKGVQPATAENSVSEQKDRFTDLFERMRYDMFNRQEDGNHYVQFLIQPGIYNYVNKLPSYEANVVKYISRHEFKNGLKDVKKAIECAKQLAAIRYGVEL